LPTPGGVQGQSAADGADDGDGGVPGQPVEVEHLGSVPNGQVHGRQRGTVDVVQERGGDLPQSGLGRGEQAEVPQLSADDVAAGVPAGQHAAGDQLGDQSMGTGQRQAGAAGNVAEPQLAMGAVEGVQDRQHASGDAGARLRRVARHTMPFAQRKNTLATPGPDAYRPSEATPILATREVGVPESTQAEISAEIAAIGADYAGRRGRTALETGPLLDYRPYRSSVLRHPTKDLHHADPEAIEL
jgi:hypothetical protein